MSIQVLGTQKLEQLHISSFSDYAQYLPSVAFAANASGGGLNDPGFANVYMRGVVSGGDGNPTASLPSVGIYLDEQPVTTIGGALDIHVYDVARVEALAGPQGTLYGASSESGTIRIITNKPDTSGFSAAYDVKAKCHRTWRHRRHGRGLCQHSAVGQYRHPPCGLERARLGLYRQCGRHGHGRRHRERRADVLLSPLLRPYVQQRRRAQERQQPDRYYRRSRGPQDRSRRQLDHHACVHGQDTKAYGSFAFDPNVGDLKVVKFTPEFSHDRWYQAALTIEGKIANLDVTYAGAYMDRKVDSQLDYSDYSFFYDAYYGQYFTNDHGNPVNPDQKVIGKDHYTKDSHELRIASPAEDRLRFVAGLFYSRESHFIIQQYTVNDWASDLWVPGWANTLYLADEMRVDTDYAAFGEVSYNLLPSLTLTAGGRVFESNNSLKGFSASAKPIRI